MNAYFRLRQNQHRFSGSYSLNKAVQEEEFGSLTQKEQVFKFVSTAQRRQEDSIVCRENSSARAAMHRSA